MSGTYFNPLHRVFLNLSGGTVTGNTLFTQSVSAATIYSGATDLYDIFAPFGGGGGGGNTYLSPTHIGFGSSISGLTGSTGLTYLNNTLTVSGDGSSNQILVRVGNNFYIQDNISGFSDRSIMAVAGMVFSNAASTPNISATYLEFTAGGHFYVNTPNMYFNDTKLYLGTYPHVNTHNFEVAGITKLSALTANTIVVGQAQNSGAVFEVRQGASNFNVGLDTQYSAYTAIHFGSARTDTNFALRGDATNAMQLNGGTRLDLGVGGFGKILVYSDHNRINIPTHIGDPFHTITPTAYLDLYSASTAIASLRIRSGTTVSSPNDGDIWNEGTHLYGKIGGVVRQLDNDNGSGTTFMGPTQIAFGSSVSGLTGSTGFYYNNNSAGGYSVVGNYLIAGTPNAGLPFYQEIYSPYSLKVGATNLTNNTWYYYDTQSNIHTAPGGHIFDSVLRANSLSATSLTATTARVNIITATTISANTIQSDSLRGSTERMVQADTGGTIHAVQEIVSGIVTDPTAIALLTTFSNWNMAGVYTGATITNTYQGQFYGDTGDTYVYLALADNYFARIPRV